VAEQVDAVLASSSRLAEKFARRGLRVEKVLNACAALSLPDWKHHARPDMVLGYLGCLGHWFDWPLVVRLAEAVPQARIELIGPCAVPPPGRLPPNIRLLPPCRHSDAAKHLARFSAGLIPFRRTELTASVDPIKFYEYRALGLPVLSTTFGEMAFRGADDGVYFLDHSDDLAAAVAQAARHVDDPAQVAQFRRDHDWRERFVTAGPFRRLAGQIDVAPFPHFCDNRTPCS
jgi:hypothetical protein